MSYMNDEYEVMRAEIQRLHRVCYDLEEEDRKLRILNTSITAF